MKFIKKIENSIRNIVEGGILKGISSEIHPLEISKKIFELIQFKAAKTAACSIAPNYFVVKLSSHDYGLFEKAGKELMSQIYTYIDEHARQEKYIFPDKIKITIEDDKKGKPGKCKIESDFAVREKKAGFASIEKFAPFLDALFLFSGFEEDKIFPLLKDETTIGRDFTCDVFIVDPNMSRVHAKIFKKKCWLIEDLKSKNGTLVNGERITMKALNNKDIIELGASKLQFLEL